MIAEELLNYISENIERGYRPEDLRQALLDAGWEEGDIDAAFEHIHISQTIRKRQQLDSQPTRFFKQRLLAGALTSLMVISLLGFGYIYYQKTDASESRDYSRYTDRLNMDVRLYDTKYEIGEAFQGNFYISYGGEPFSGVVLYSISKEGSSRSAHFTKYGEFQDVDFDDANKKNGLEIKLQPYRFQNASIHSLDEAFDQSGTYTYKLSAFACEEVELATGKSCQDLKAADLINQKPLKTASRDVEVYRSKNK